MSNNTHSTRIYGLDVLRTIAISTVLISHSKFLIFEFIQRSTIEKYIKPSGFYGVEIFFILSGFLIGGILINTYKENQFKLSTLYNFWIKRWFRTIPNYYFFFAINTLIYFYIKGDLLFKWDYLIFVQNFMSRHPSFFPEAWSLAVEEWFYIIIPIVLFVVLYFYKNKQKGILITIIGFLVVFTFIRIIYVYNYDPSWDSGIKKIVLFRLDSLMYGVLFAYLFYYHKDFFKKYKDLLFQVGIFLFLLFYIEFLIGMKVHNFFYKTLFFSFTSLSFALMIPKMYYVVRKENSLIVYFNEYIAKISYSMYLSHLGILTVYKELMVFQKGTVYGFHYWLLYIVLVLVVSSITYNFIEKPFIKIRSKLLIK